MALLTVILMLWAVIIILKSKPENPGFYIENTLPLRGLLAVLIIVHHVSQRLTYGCPDTYWCRILNQFNTWGYLIVSVFFFLSGYGLMKSYIQRKEDYIAGFIRKRTTKITTPFIICIVVYALLDFCLYGNKIDLSLDAWRFDCPLLPNSWYVIAIIIFYLAFYIFGRVQQKERRLIVSFFAFTLGYMILLNLFGFKRYWWFTTPCISFGMLMAYNEARLAPIFAKKKTCISVVSLLWVAINISDLQYYLHTVDEFTSIMFSIAKSFCFAFFVFVCITISGFVRNTILRNLGNISYEIYLVQGGVISLLFPSVGKYPIVFFISTVLLSIILAYLLGKISKQIITTCLK